MPEQIARRHLHVRGTQPFIFLRIDEPLRLARRPAGLIQIQFPADALDQAQLIVTVENLEILRQASFFPVCLQQPVSEAMESAHPHAVGRQPQHFLEARAHLARRLVGKRYRENGPGRHILGANQPGNTVHQHAGLAAAGARQHQQVGAFVSNRFTLGGIQWGENIGYVHRTILPKFCRARTNSCP